MDKRKFISMFTKEEIIETLFDAVPEWTIDDIFQKLYEVRSNKLFENHQMLLDQLKTATSVEFFIIMQKLDKSNKKLIFLSDNYEKLF